MGDARSLKY